MKPVDVRVAKSGPRSSGRIRVHGAVALNHVLRDDLTGLVGEQLFVAGQVPHDVSGQIVGLEDANAQAVECLDNLRTLLGVHHFSTDDIRQLTIYVVGEHQHLVDAWSAVLEWFGGEVPPATLLGINMLGHAGQLVEIDATIVRPETT